MEKLLLKNCRYIVTQNPGREILEKRDILIQGFRIGRIGRISERCKTIDCTGMIAMPGLVNMHTHTCTNILRGVSDDLCLKDWLEKKVWPAEARIDDIYYGALLTAIESIKSGTTCFVDHSFQIDRVALAVRETGIRAFLGYCMLDMFDTKKAKSEIEEGLETINELTRDGLITPTVAVHAPNTCSEMLLKESAKISEQLGLLNVAHILETNGEAVSVKKRTSKRVIQYLDSIGFLNSKTLGIHMCWLTKADERLLAKRGVSGVHCPTSNMKLASGARMPVPELLKAGVKVGLGTDSNASNNNQDIFEEMKQVGLLHKYALNDPTAMPAQAILDMATVAAGEILGTKTGAIMPGHLADIITLSAANPRLFPLSRRNLVSHLVYSASGSDVCHSIINGRLVMQNRLLAGLNEENALGKVQEYFEKRKLF